MTPKAEALREKLKSFGRHDRPIPEAIARTIVEELGITEEMIDGVADMSEYQLTGMAVTALSTLLELAGADDGE